MEDTIRRVYEVSYLLVPSLDDDAALARANAVKAFFTEKGIEIISEEAPRLIDLAYVMERVINHKRAKFTQAYFGWVKFEATPGDVDAVKTFVEAEEAVIRSLIVKTIRENTLSKKAAPRDAKRKDKEEGDTEEEVLETPVVAAPVLDEQAVDDQIESLVEEK